MYLEGDISCLLNYFGQQFLKLGHLKTKSEDAGTFADSLLARFLVYSGFGVEFPSTICLGVCLRHSFSDLPGVGLGMLLFGVESRIFFLILFWSHVVRDGYRLLDLLNEKGNMHWRTYEAV